MTDTPNVRTTLQALQVRASRDAEFLKLLDDIDRRASIADSVVPDPEVSNSLANLPYSSDPPRRGETWPTR